ncbi:hypothetical protein SAMN02910456_01327 [Ruminococcaceae bacterium YRB3002]|nr:hypothetical protein SAMN02910456_01327 [Ruminococcaceae bacterium YRB3002]
MLTIIFTIIGAVVAGIVYVIYRYATYMKEHQWDRHTVMVVVADLAVTMFLAGEIRSVITVNLVMVQMAVFLIYSGMRALYEYKKESYL